MRLLIVDDDPLIAEFVRRGLQEEGHVVDVAHDGEHGRMLALVEPYDALILDVVLPDAMGHDIAREIRARNKDVPILMLTSKSRTEDIVSGLDAGADDYLVKPFQLDELKARVRALVRRGGAVRDDTLDFAGVTLDRKTRRAFVDKSRLKLTPKEFTLLERFLLSPEKTLTRTDLLEKVWDIHFDPGSNVVDVHVARLRRKLRSAKATPAIVTVRGVGFALTDDPSAFDDDAA
ncbi:MAG: response regulator transcription factor [Longimicrobiales bacterium]